MHEYGLQTHIHEYGLQIYFLVVDIYCRYMGCRHIGTEYLEYGTSVVFCYRW